MELGIFVEIVFFVNMGAYSAKKAQEILFIIYLSIDFFIFLSSDREKATEALYIERILTRLGVAFVSEFSA